MMCPGLLKMELIIKGSLLYVDDTRYEYTNEVKMHLTNLGFATGYDAAESFSLDLYPEWKIYDYFGGQFPDQE